MTNLLHNHTMLMQVAYDLGVSSVRIVPTARLSVEQRLSELCADPQCPSYGLAPGCPPHAMKSSEFASLVANYVHVLVFKKDVPVQWLYDHRRLEVARSIHTIAGQLEKHAQDYGMVRATGWAAGSCKELFCNEFQHCAVLAGEGECLFKGQAKPSISAVGVDVTVLCEYLGWELLWHEKNTAQAAESEKALMLGLVLLE